MERMELARGPEQPGLLVKMLQETRGKTCRTKYMIRMKAEDEEITEPANLPDGGFLVQMPPERGSNDLTMPQLPSPGDIRRMFGNDKIDCEPEYTITIDPDWSGVSPTITADVEKKNRDEESTKALLRKYRKIEEKRKPLKNYRQCPKPKSRSVSEGVKRKTSKQEGKPNNGKIFSKLKKHGLGVSNRRELLPTSSVPIKQRGIQENNLLRSNDSITQETGGSSITFRPSRLNRKSYNTAINVVQRMNSSHWLIIDNLYSVIKRENGTNFEHLNDLVCKIVQEIYGIDCEFILATIHPDSVQRIVKLGKLMLNIYHQAVFGSTKKSKQLKAGTHNKNFMEKSIQVYTTFTPCKYQSNTISSKIHRNLLTTCSEITKPRCMACLLKDNVNEKNAKLDQGKLWNNNNKIKKSNFKSKLKSNLSESKSNKVSIKQMDKAQNQVRLGIDNNSRLNINTEIMFSGYEENFDKTEFNMSSDVLIFSDEFLQAVSDLAEFDGRKPTEQEIDEVVKKSATPKKDRFFTETKATSSVACLEQTGLDMHILHAMSDTAVLNDREPTEQVTCEKGSEAAKSDPDCLVTETKGTSSVACLEQLFERYYKEVAFDRYDQVVGGGDVSTSNDYKVLSSLYSDSSSESMEVSKQTSCTPNLARIAKKHQTNGYVTTTKNLIIINNLLEKTLLHENDDTSKIIEEMNDDTENESYHDCETSFMAVNNPDDCHGSIQTIAKNKCNRQPRWTQLTGNCLIHKSSVRAFMTLMLGLITLYFCRGSFINAFNSQPSLKETIKQVIKTFLLGMKYKFVQIISYMSKNLFAIKKQPNL